MLATSAQGALIAPPAQIRPETLAGTASTAPTPAVRGPGCALPRAAWLSAIAQAPPCVVAVGTRSATVPQLRGPSLGTLLARPPAYSREQAAGSALRPRCSHHFQPSVTPCSAAARIERGALRRPPPRAPQGSGGTFRAFARPFGVTVDHDRAGSPRSCALAGERE